MPFARLTALLFVLWFVVAGVAFPACSIAACLESHLAGEVEEKDEIDPCPSEEFLAGPGQHVAGAHGQRHRRSCPRPPALSTSARRASVAAGHDQPHPKPGSALPLRC